MLFYKETIESVYKKLSVSTRGLTKLEASERLKQYGKNAITIKGEPLWRKLAEPFANVFSAVLFVAVIISFTHHAYLDAGIILFIMVVSAVIYYVQRFSTERILRSLQEKSAQNVAVIRSGESTTVEALNLVPGDIIQLSEGDKIPADIRLTAAESLRVDESVLTGESVPVQKQTDALAEEKEIYEQSNMLFQGSFITSGQAMGVVVATGNNTEFGKIASLSKPSEDAHTSPVQKKIDKLISYIIGVVAAVAVAAFVLAILRGIEVSEALRFVIALSVSAVPEGLPVAISIILALGMRRMAAKKALVRSMRAIETIGVITTIATDKTGTLTKNELSVQETWQTKGSKAASLSTLLYRSVNASNGRITDPLDNALFQYTKGDKNTKLSGTATKLLPFDQSVAMSGAIWRAKSNYELYVKGAPEHIIAGSDISKADKAEAEAALKKLTSQGYRVLACATTTLSKPIDSLSELKKKSLTFGGLIAVADTLRPTAHAAIATARRAGVTVRMITGDHFETAFAIGEKLGLVTTREEVFDSRKMTAMKDKELIQAVHKARIFSRVTPENKYRILQVLKLKEVTAMTGDGVNDVPALANAHVGVAMGSGTQIAKDAGDIILLNDDFSGIVRAMREGRIIFANIQRMLIYLLSTNIGEVLVMLGALIIGMPMPLAAVQILWINLVTDTTMVIPLGLEPGEKTTMRQKPVSPTAPILSKYMVWRIVIVAVTMSILALGLYAYFNAQYGTAYAQTIVFFAVVVVQWANAFNARSTYDSVFTRLKVWHGAFWIGLAISILLQFLVVNGPLQEVLHVHPVSWIDIAWITALSFVVAIIPVEIHKYFGRKQLEKQK